MTRYLTILGWLLASVLSHHPLQAQSLEVMAGRQGLMVDVQWLEAFEGAPGWSLFSRTTAQVDTAANTTFYTGGFLNYSLPMGLGATLVGTVTPAGASGDAGVHFAKGGPEWMLFTLLATDLAREWGVWSFTILRYQPKINEDWRGYSSLELFSHLNGLGHTYSTQRVRLGAGYRGIQTGVALNLVGLGPEYQTVPAHLGLFLRKQF